MALRSRNTALLLVQFVSTGAEVPVGVAVAVGLGDGLAFALGVALETGAGVALEATATPENGVTGTDVLALHPARTALTTSAPNFTVDLTRHIMEHIAP